MLFHNIEFDLQRAQLVGPMRTEGRQQFALTDQRSAGTRIRHPTLAFVVPYKPYSSGVKPAALAISEM